MRTKVLFRGPSRRKDLRKVRRCRIGVLARARNSSSYVVVQIGIVVRNASRWTFAKCFLSLLFLFFRKIIPLKESACCCACAGIGMYRTWKLTYGWQVKVAERLIVAGRACLRISKRDGGGHDDQGNADIHHERIALPKLRRVGFRVRGYRFVALFGGEQVVQYLKKIVSACLGHLLSEIIYLS